MENQPISTDTLLQIIGIKEVEIHMLKQQVQTLTAKIIEMQKQGKTDTTD